MGNDVPPVDPSMPNFIYPPNQVSSDSSPVSLGWNFIDTVNVSWTMNNPGDHVDYQTYLALWWQDDNGNLTQLQNTTINTSGSKTYELNIGQAYPAVGLFNIIYAFPNGTNETGPISQYFNVVHDASQPAQAWSATSSKAAAVSSPTVTPDPSDLTNLNNNSTSSPSSSNPQNLSPGAIAGIVVGAIAAIGLLSLLAFFVSMRYRRRRQSAYNQIHAKEAQLNNIYASARSSADDTFRLGTEAPEPPRAPRRGRFVELIASIASPRDLHAPWHRHGPNKEGMLTIDELQKRGVEGKDWAVPPAAELPANEREVMEMNAWRSPTEMEGGRL